MTRFDPFLRAWRGALDGVLDALYPPRCVAAGCGRRGAWLCADCAARIRPVPQPSCPRCGNRVPPTGFCAACRVDPPAFVWARAGGVYAAPLRDAVHALKYRGRYALAPVLAGRLGQVLPDLPAGVVVVPIPAHASRTAERGVDHTLRLAAALAACLGAPCQPAWLVRTRATRPQVGLEPAERWANVAGAFEAADGVVGASILLVDDVLTTGATARAAADALAQAGAGWVAVATVARALEPGDRGLA